MAPHNSMGTKTRSFQKRLFLRNLVKMAIAQKLVLEANGDMSHEPKQSARRRARETSRFGLLACKSLKSISLGNRIFNASSKQFWDYQPSFWP